MSTEFRNEPFTDLVKKRTRRRCARRWRSEKRAGREYPLVIGGERIMTDSKLDSFNPANRTQLVGAFKSYKRTRQQAVESAYQAFQSWKNTNAQDRADLYSASLRSFASASTTCLHG